MKPIHLLLSLVFVGCINQTKNDNAVVSSPGIDSLVTGESLNMLADGNDTFIIDKKCAVLYSPDSARIEQRKKQVGEDKFLIGADDYLFTMHNATDFLDSNKVTIVDAADKKYLRFVNSYKSEIVIRIDTLPALWGIYFFDPAKQVKEVDATNIEEEFKTYFN